MRVPADWTHREPTTCSLCGLPWAFASPSLSFTQHGNAHITRKKTDVSLLFSVGLRESRSANALSESDIHRNRKHPTNIPFTQHTSHSLNKTRGWSRRLRDYRLKLRLGSSRKTISFELKNKDKYSLTNMSAFSSFRPIRDRWKAFLSPL